MRSERITLLPEFNRLNEKNADTYFLAEQYVSKLDDLIIKDFESNLKALTGFNNDFLPETEEKLVEKLGDYEFTITSSKKTKKPGSKAIFDNFRNYLSTLRNNFTKGTKQKGVIKIKNEPYTSLKSLIDEFSSIKDKATGFSLSQPIIYEGPSDFHNILMLPKKDVMLNSTTASLYAHANYFIEKLSSIVKDFETALKTETGYGNNNVPERTTRVWNQLGKHDFLVKVIRREPVKYASVFKTLYHETKTKTSGTKTSGDFAELPNCEDSVLEYYKPVERTLGTTDLSFLQNKKIILVSIPGTISRLDDIKRESITAHTKMEITPYPVV